APPPAPLNSPSGALVPPPDIVSPSASSWQASSPCYCCSPVGGNGPIGAEVFLESGATLPAGGGALNSRLRPGWMTEWGGRTLLFNTAGTAAWTAEIAISYQLNNGLANTSAFDFFGIPVHPHELHRWAFSYGGGRDWFLYNSDRDGGLGKNIRFGVDIGGRWGTSHVNLLEAGNPDKNTNYIRRQDVFRS